MNKKKKKKERKGKKGKIKMSRAIKTWHKLCSCRVMINELINRQILSLSRQGGTAEEIAETLGIGVEEVKIVLNAWNVGTREDRDINDEQLAALRHRAFNLAMQDDCLPIAAKMTEFLIERDRPREKVSVSPITAINNALIVANDSFKKLLDGYKEPV